MARGRARYSEGYITLTSANEWLVHWFEYVTDPETGIEKRKHRSRTVGNKSAMTKAQAKIKLRELSGAPHATKDGDTSLGWFIDNRWKPCAETAWSHGTKQTNEQLLAQIKAKFGTTPLQKLDKVAMQAWLNDLAAKGGSRSTIGHLWSFLRTISAEAVEEDFLLKDPARKLKQPPTREPDSTVLEWADYQRVLGMLGPGTRDSLVLKVGAATAVRPEELFAFRWRHMGWRKFDLEPPVVLPVLLVEDTVYRGVLRPHKGKTPGSLDYVALPRRLATELEDFRRQTKYAGDDDFVFANANGGFMWKENFLRRVFYPIQNALKLPKLNFQVLRRTFSTHAYDQGLGTVKDIQKQLRHSKPSTALEHYIKSIPVSVFEMVDAAYELINPSVSAGPGGTIQ